MGSAETDDGTGMWVVSARPREVELGAEEWMSRAILELGRALHPVLGLVRHEVVNDVPRPVDRTDADEPPESSHLYRSMKAGHELVVTVEEALDFDVESFLTHLYEIADSYGSQLTAGILQHISDVCDASGQTIDAKGKSVWDAMLEAAESVEWSFDEHGNHSMSMVVDPDLHKKMLEDPPSEEQSQKMAELIERKRREWHASRHRSDLP